MKDYLTSVVRTCERAVDICADVIGEINDGDERSALVLSSMESVYSLQSLLRAYILRYPEYFFDDSSNLVTRLGSRARKFLKVSPERWLQNKMHSRCFQNESSSVKYLDDLPF